MAHEFWWTIIFARIRFGMRGGDDSIPDANRARKWRYLPDSRRWVNVESRRTFSAKDYELRAHEVEEDFTKNVVMAPPRDLPAEPEFWKVLTNLRTKPTELCRMARQSQYLGWPYLNVLLRHAREFCYSKRDRRYPRAGLLRRSQNRLSSEDKRADYFARVMAGLSLRKPLSGATAVDLLRKFKHSQNCFCWHCKVSRT
jgi:hypothetical protein